MLRELFFAVEDPAGLGVFRICFGLLLLANCVWHFRDAPELLFPDGLYPIQEYRKRSLRGHFSLFRMLPPTRWATQAILAAYGLSAIALTLGFATRPAALVAFLCLSSIRDRNPWTTHSGDTVMAMLTFLLIFSNAGKAYSLDNVIHGSSQAGPIWAHRLMQIQIALVYAHTFLWKLKGRQWRNGEAVYYAMNFLAHRRRTLPSAVYNAALFRMATYGTLLVEGSIGFLVWIPRLRYYVLAAGVMMHVFIGYYMRMHLFQITMIVSFLLFLESSDVRELMTLVAAFVR